MTYLSDIKMGYEMGILNEPKAKINIYGLVMNIQPGNLQKKIGLDLNNQEIDEKRASFIREQFNYIG